MPESVEATRTRLTDGERQMSEGESRTHQAQGDITRAGPYIYISIRGGYGMSVCIPIDIALASTIHRCASMGNGLVEVMKATVRKMHLAQ